MKYKVFRCALTIISYSEMADKSSSNELCILCKQPTFKCPLPGSLHKLMEAVFKTSEWQCPCTPPSVREREDDLLSSEGEEGEEGEVVVTADS